MKSTTLFLLGTFALILSGFIFFSDMSGIIKVLLIWLALSVPVALLFGRIFPKRGR